MGVRTNSLGGIYLHKLFMFPTDNNMSSSPFHCAEYAIRRIKQKSALLHILLTLDVLFIDILTQISAKQIGAIDITLRKLLESQIPFGGVLILGNMDHTQIQPIIMLPFLTSTLVLTCFQAVQLQHLVRGYGDIDFQRLQLITRMNPSVLSNDLDLKYEFVDFSQRILTFVPNGDGTQIEPNMIRAFSRICPAQEALNEYIEFIKRHLQNTNTIYRVSKVSNLQQRWNTNSDYSAASQHSIKALNKELKEPSELIFCWLCV